MSTLILKTATRFLLPLLLLISLFILLRGHNHTGGGFVGGMFAAAAFALYAIAYGVPAAEQVLRVDARLLIGTGLLVALASGLVAIFFAAPFMSAAWMSIDVPGLGSLHVGTPLLFDVGVYLVVLGVALTIILALVE